MVFNEKMAFEDPFKGSSTSSITAESHRYAKANDTQEMSNLLSRGLDVDTKHPYRRTTALMLCTRQAIQDEHYSYSSIVAMEILLDSNADLYVTNAKGSSALSLVVEESHKWMANLTPEANRLKILELFFHRVGRDFVVDRESTARRLRDVGFPLALVPFMQNNTVTEYFLEHDCSFIRRVGGLPILHVAVLRQDLECVKILVDRDADLNVVDSYEQTALFAHNVDTPDTGAKLQILRILLQRGASLLVQRRDGVTPLKHLLQNGNRKTRLTVLNSDSIGKCKFASGAALCYLIRNQNIEQMEDLREEIGLLLCKGFDVNALDGDRSITALTFAVENRPGILEFLARNGAEVNWLELIRNTCTLSNLACARHGKLRKYYQNVVRIMFECQLGMSVKRLFKKLNRGFPRKINNLFYVQILIANLAIAMAKGEPMPLRATKCMEAKKVLKEHYDICKERIKQMKTIEVCGSVSLYQLLIDSDEKIDRRVRNQDFVVELQRLIGQKCYQNLYYFVVLRQRIENAVKMKELRNKCGQLVCQLTGLDKHGVSEDHYVVYKIVSYLGKRDIVNLFDGQQVTYDNTTSTQKAPRVLGNFLTRSIKKIFV